MHPTGFHPSPVFTSLLPYYRCFVPISTPLQTRSTLWFSFFLLCFPGKSSSWAKTTYLLYLILDLWSWNFLGKNKVIWCHFKIKLLTNVHESYYAFLGGLLFFLQTSDWYFHSSPQHVYSLPKNLAPIWGGWLIFHWGNRRNQELTHL